VFVYGISYGSYEVLRYLKYFPQQPTGVIVEGIVPEGFRFEDYDRNTDRRAQDLFALCHQDPVCGARLGPDPWATAASVVRSFDSGHCAGLGLDAAGARAFLGSYLAVWPFRDYAPLLVYRMQRCNAADVAAIGHFYSTLASFGLSFNDGKAVTEPAFYHVALSEMWHWDGLPTVASVEADWDKTVMSSGIAVRLAQRQADWPTYPRTGLDGALPAYDGPLLMLQGRLDAAAAVEGARRLQSTYVAPQQTWAEFPYGAHAVYTGTPTTSGKDCGEQIVFQFLDDPAAPIDLACIGDTAAPEFSGTPSLNLKTLGVEDGWDG
jgi:pimeloyl-ACP methyl ester carboxylesterase